MVDQILGKCVLCIDHDLNCVLGYSLTLNMYECVVVAEIPDTFRVTRPILDEPSKEITDLYDDAYFSYAEDEIEICVADTLDAAMYLLEEIQPSFDMPLNIAEIREYQGDWYVYREIL